MFDKELPVEIGRALRACGGVLAAPVALPRSRNRDELGLLLDSWNLHAATAATGLPAPGSYALADDVPGALRRLARELGPADAVLVTGSCFMVAEALHHLGYARLADSRQPREAGPVLATWGREST
jgi:hypothetical protein